jgi:hypothetical protein
MMQQAAALAEAAVMVPPNWTSGLFHQRPGGAARLCWGVDPPTAAAAAAAAA